MAKSRSKPVLEAAVPTAELWQGPMAWAGSPLKPVENYSRAFPDDAVFVRAELLFTLDEVVAPGRSRQMEHAIPGLLRLNDGKPVEVHCTWLDGQCWTYRLERVGRKFQWLLFTGGSFPANVPATRPVNGASTIEQVVVQSVLPMASSSKFISFAIQNAGSSEDFAKASDPDPRD
jgi:hypothetical protein